MFGFISNRSDLGTQALRMHSNVLRVKRRTGESLGWGIGFYQSGEVLLRRRPIDERDVIDLVEAAGKVRTDLLIGHVRRASVGTMRTENTHPFRYRSWLFAQTGTIQGFDRLRDRLLESQPEFLRHNVRGETDSELFFYLFLSFLHDAGHLGEDHVAPQHVRSALRASIALVDRLSAEEGFPKNTGNLLVANGEHLIAALRDGAMAYRLLKGRFDVEELLGQDGVQRARIPSIDSTRFTLIASDLDEVPERWESVKGQQLVTMTRTDDPEFEAL
jgi:glutamine amidotransferase